MSLPELYISTCPNLGFNKDALRIIHDSDVIDGIELSEISDEYKLIKKSGIKISAHTPGLQMTLNLARKDFSNCFNGEEGENLFSFIKEADAPTVGLHLGYSAERIYKMYSCPSIPQAGTMVIDRQELMTRIIRNVLIFHDRINAGLDNKLIVLEGLDYSRDLEINWEIQPIESRDNKDEILNTISSHGINAGLSHVTDISFAKDILKELNLDKSVNIGYLLDISHTYITADTKIFNGEFSGSIDNYFESLIDNIGQYVEQIHVSIPKERVSGGFIDNHGPFIAEELLSEHILELTRFAFKNAPNLQVMTLEMKTGHEPMNHVVEMEKQSTYFSKKIIV